MEYPEPYDPSCKRYARDMKELDYSWAEDEDDLKLPKEEKQRRRIEFVQTDEGTFNTKNGHFLCNSCYIKAGCPSSARGWICP